MLMLFRANTLHGVGTDKHDNSYLLLEGPVAPEPCDSLLEPESEERSVVGRAAGGGRASDFSDRFSLRVLKTTIMSSWQRINCVVEMQNAILFLFKHFLIS